jgi:sugar phosphate isomerase/epimerase
MKLGVDIFSLRFNEWNAFELLEYASQLGLQVVHFSEMEPFESLEVSYLQDVKRAADDLGISIEVGMGSICPTSTTFSPERGTVKEQLIEMLHVAAELGSPALRCYLGSNADRRTDMPLEGHCVAVVANLRDVRSLALDLDVKIAIENHAGDLQGRELARLIEKAGPDFVGACIDSGNPLWVAESPFVTLSHLAPYVIMSHIRDTAVWPHPRGAVAQWVAMGEGTVGIDRWSQMYLSACPNTNFTLEIITSLPPRLINYMDEEYWSVYPQTPASEFAQYLELVQGGRPYTEPVLTANWADMTEEVRKAIALQQQAKLEQSVAYCRDTLGVG